MLLRGAVKTLVERVWDVTTAAVPFDASAQSDLFYDKLLALTPQNDAQRQMQSKAVQIGIDLGQTRILLAQSGNVIPTPFLIVLVFWITLIFVSFGMFFMSSLSLALNLYTSEIYPTRIRAFGGAVGGAWQRVAAFLGPNVIAWLLPYGTSSLFLYFGGLALIGGVLSFFYAVETKGKTLEELSP